jgi:hypothetical protein
MKKLAPSEKLLFAVLCGAVFVALNLLGLRAFLQARAKVQQAIAAAKTELASDRNWLDIADSLHPGMSWINAHPFPEMPPDDASAQLLQFEQGEAEKAGLKVQEENLLPPQDVPQGSSVGVGVKLSGPFAGVVHFLYSLQSPTAWRSIDKLTLRSDTEPPNVIADLEIRQYFHPGTASDEPKAEEDPKPEPDAKTAAEPKAEAETP